MRCTSAAEAKVTLPRLEVGCCAWLRTPNPARSTPVPKLAQKHSFFITPVSFLEREPDGRFRPSFADTVARPCVAMRIANHLARPPGNLNPRSCIGSDNSGSTSGPATARTPLDGGTDFETDVETRCGAGDSESRSGRTALVSPAARFKTGRFARRFAGRSPQWIQIVQAKSKFDASGSLRDQRVDAARGVFRPNSGRFGSEGEASEACRFCSHKCRRCTDSVHDCILFGHGEWAACARIASSATCVN